MRKLAVCTASIFLFALPACDDSPTEPDPPTLGPAQLTVQIAVNQATSATNVGPTGPAAQTRRINSSVTIANSALSVDADLEDLRIFGSIVGGPNAYDFEESVTEPDLPATVPTGGSVTVDTEIEVDINAPFDIGTFFDVSAEVTYVDSLGNSGTTSPVSTSVDPTLTLPPAGGCTQSPSIDCVHVGGNNRFRVQVTWSPDPGAGLQPATVGQQFADGAFWFFGPDDPELLVRILDGCSDNGRFWVFTASNTHGEVVIRVEDTTTSVFKEYRNPPGAPFQALQDNNAFATCPGPLPVP